MSIADDNMEHIRDEYQRFRAEFKSVLLTTISRHGVPDSSYEDYVRYDDDYYIYASELAPHTKNLLDTGSASMLFIEGGRIDNVRPDQKRVVMKSSVSRVEHDSPGFRKVLKLFEQRFIDFPRMLASLPGFHLFRITPRGGAYVRGTANAYLLDGDRLLHPDEARTRDCHRTAPGEPSAAPRSN